MSPVVLDLADIDRQLVELATAPHWYLGFSGGLDSTVLLHLLQRWRRCNPGTPPLTAIHVNHGLQDAANDWQVHCESICAELQIPLVQRSVILPDASEAAAREARYGVFEELLQEGAVLFLGHHLDDQVETFFLRLMRGAGVHGLASMPARRKLGEGQLVRPLLHSPRSQLQSYATEHALQHVEDPSNTDTGMDRNFLRGEVLPLLARRWPAYRQTVARASAHMAGTVTTLEQVLPAPATLFSVLGDPGLDLAELLDGAPEAAALRLRSWLLARGCAAPDQAQLEEFLRQLRDASPQKRPMLEYSAAILQRYRDALYLLPDKQSSQRMVAVTLQPGDICEIPGVGTVGLLPAAGEGLSLAPGDSLHLDWRRGGERTTPRGRAGSNSLKKLLQERAVPPWWRDRVPLLYLGDELLAVGDLWLCESSRYRTTAEPSGHLWQLDWQRNTKAAGD